MAPGRIVVLMPDFDSYDGRVQMFMAALLANPRITPEMLTIAVGEARSVRRLGEQVGALATGHSPRLVGSFVREEAARLLKGAKP